MDWTKIEFSLFFFNWFNKKAYLWCLFDWSITYYVDLFVLKFIIVLLLQFFNDTLFNDGVCFEYNFFIKHGY